MQIAIDDVTSDTGRHLLLEALRKNLEEHRDLRILAIGGRGAFPNLRLRLLTIISAGLAGYLRRPLDPGMVARAMNSVRAYDVEADLRDPLRRAQG